MNAGVAALIDSAVIATTSHLPNNWLGLRLAIGLRRIVTMRLSSRDAGVDVERWGLRMRLHPLDNGCEKGLLFTPQMYEARERAELAGEIETAAWRPFVFIDIGANVGLFSLFVASRTGPNAIIVAIEPDSENLRRLRFNVAANPGVPIQVLPIALGEVSGLVAVESNHSDRGGTRARPCETGMVECLTLLEVLQRDSISSIDALKIDVEGTEDRILVPFFRNAGEDLWPRLILIEDNRDSWRDDLFVVLADRGYIISARTKQNVILRRTR
jgi:FkbM family methyltransferase